MYTPQLAAGIAGVSRKTVMDAINAKKLNATRNNRNHWVISKDDLKAWMDSRRVKPIADTLTDTSSDTTSDNITSQPFDLSIYRSNTIHELKYAAALEAITHERKLLREQVNELRQRAEAAEERSEAAAERYHDSIKIMTRLIEDKREPQQRKKFLGIF